MVREDTYTTTTYLRRFISFFLVTIIGWSMGLLISKSPRYSDYFVFDKMPYIMTIIDLVTFFRYRVKHEFSTTLTNDGID